MILKILGSVSPYPKRDNNCVGYLIYDIKNNQKILLDCGNGITRLMKFPEDLEDLTIIISHLHKDHYADLSAIAYASYVYHNLGLLSSKVKVYIPNSKDLEDYHYLINYGPENYMNFYIYDEKSNLNINDINVSFYQTQHSIKTFAMNIIKENIKVSYSADTGYDENISSFFQDADILICEASFLKHQKNGNRNHLSTEEAAVIAKKSSVKKLILSHFWPEIDKLNYLNEAKNIFKKVDVALENKEYHLKKVRG